MTRMGLRRCHWCSAGLALWLASSAAAPIGAPASGPPAAEPARRVFGAPFALRTAGGEPVTDQSYAGRWRLVFFGYLSCPDVCPTALAAMGGALERLGASADAIAPLFITLDPGRDTPEQLAAYVANFSTRIVALTGSEDQAHAAATVFGVRYAIVGDAASGSYMIDHPAAMLLFDPHGRFTTLIPGGATADEVARTIRLFMARHE